VHGLVAIKAPVNLFKHSNRHKKNPYSMEIQRLNELLVYEPLTGEIFTRLPFRKMCPDSENFIVVWDRLQQKRTKFKVDRLAWQLGNNKRLRKNQRVLHKNLNTDDNRLVNLSTVSLSIFSKINEAARNLKGELRVLPHEKDQYDFCVHYFENKLKRAERFSDIVFAQKRLLVLQLKFAKVLTKYCLFE
jgi:hypothetical protein